MVRTGRFHKWFSMVYRWKTNGQRSTDLKSVQMSVKLIFNIWIESVVSAPLGAGMKGVSCEKKELRCRLMKADERKVDYQHMVKTEDLLKVSNSMKNSVW